MSKGSKQTGTQTVTQTNPVQEAQMPYLKETWDTAKAFYNNPAVSQRYYPFPTVADYATPDANLAAGYRNLISRGGAVDQNLLPVANQAFTGAVGGQYGVQGSPAYQGLTQFAQGLTYPQRQFGDLYGAASGMAPTLYNATSAYAPQAAQYGMQGAGYGSQGAQYGAMGAANNNIGLNSLMGMAQGLGGNPYLSQAIQGAIDPLVRNYQTATAPGISAQATQAGRYGSGAMAGMYDTAQRNLAQGIGNVTANMQNAAYEAERGRQLQAASQGGQLYNQGLGLGLQGADVGLRGLGLGLQGLTAAGNLQSAAGSQYLSALDRAQSAAAAGGQGQQFGLQNLQSGYQSGNAAALQALGYTPQFLQAQYSSPLAQIQAGQGLWGIGKDAQTYQQQQIDADKARWDYNTRLPWTDLGMYQQAIGGALGGSQTTSQPIYGNPTADALSGLLGATGIARNLGLFGSGAAGGFGASSPLLASSILPGAALNAGNLFGAGSAIAASAAAPASAALPVAASTLPPALEALGFILPAASDRRLKEDDKVVGLLGDLPIHTFRYKGDDKQRIGFMADEVERVDPGAVTTMPNGYKAVYYGRAAQSALNSMMR